MAHNIRPVTAADTDAFRQLRLEALRLHPTAFAADLAEAEARPLEAWRRQVEEAGGAGSGVIMVAETPDGAGLAGMGGVYTPPEPKVAHGGVVWGVYVREQFRRRGVAQGLVEACARWARGKGLVGLRLSAVDDPAAVRCYGRCGFVAYGVEPFAVRWEGRLYDEVLMALRL